MHTTGDEIFAGCVIIEVESQVDADRLVQILRNLLFEEREHFSISENRFSGIGADKYSRRELFGIRRLWRNLAATDHPKLIRIDLEHGRRRFVEAIDGCPENALECGQRPLSCRLGVHCLFEGEERDYESGYQR